MKSKNLRRYFSAVHLYIGLVLGGAFALLGLTGSFLVFYPEIDQLINPELQVNQPKPNEIKVQYFFNQLHVQFPQRQGVWRVEIPRSSGMPVFARYVAPEEKDPNLFAPLVVALDPQTGELINARFWGDYAVTWIYNLHFSLLAGKTGTVLVSILGITFLISVCIGFYLWIPRGISRLTKAIPKVRSGKQKAIYDLHSYTGAYGVFFLLILIVTGIGLATPQWLDPVVNRISSRWEKKKMESELPFSSVARISADQAIAISLKKFPDSYVRWIEAPSSIHGTYVIRIKQSGEPSDRFPKTYAWVDQYSGKVIGVRDALKVPSGDVFFDWLHPLHNGEALGLFGRWIVFGIGLIPVFLWITGLVRWRHKVIARNVK